MRVIACGFVVAGGYMTKTGTSAKKLIVAMTANKIAREREFDGISVDMICELAQISRSSFYRLFRDKYEILLWCEDLPFQRGIAQMGRTLTCAEGVRVMLEAFDMFGDLFLSTRNSSERIARETDGGKKAAALVRETLEEHQQVEIDEELEFQVKWMVRGLLDVAVAHSKQEIEGSCAELAQHVRSCAPERLGAILDKPVNPEAGESLSLAGIILPGL